MKVGRHPLSPETVRAIRRLRNAGLSWGQIGRELGISRQTAWSAYHDSAGNLRKARGNVSHNSPEAAERA